MLDIMKNQSVNKVEVSGILSELNIEEREMRDKTTGELIKYVTGKAQIKVDQAVNGEVVENIITNDMYAYEKKRDGNRNPAYDAIIKMKEDFTSLAAAEEPSQASRVIFIKGQLKENCYFNQKTGRVKSNDFQVSSNFMYKAKPDEIERATFELTGVVGKITDEIDNNTGEETGRLIVKFIIVQYGGKVDVVDLIAENPVAVNHIRTNWNEEDTVSLSGVINMTHKTETYLEEQGFGEPIPRRKTVYKKELLITRGCKCGFDEEDAYDAGSIKIALDNRAAKIKALSEPKPKAKPAMPMNDDDFAF